MVIIFVVIITREGQKVLSTIFFPLHMGCIYTKVAVSTSSMNLVVHAM